MTRPSRGGTSFPRKDDRGVSSSTSPLLNFSRRGLLSFDPNDDDDDDDDDGGGGGGGNIEDPSRRGGDMPSFFPVAYDGAYTLTIFSPCSSDSGEACASNIARPLDSSCDLVQPPRRDCNSFDFSRCSRWSNDVQWCA